MKNGLVPRTMWSVFQSGFRRNLAILHITDKKTQKDIMKSAHEKYREIVSMIDPFGENDVLLMNILSASGFAAIYLSLPEDYRLIPKNNADVFPETKECELLVSGKCTMQELADFYEYSMNENPVMKLYLKRSFFSERYWKEQKEQAAKSQKSTNPQIHIHGNILFIQMKTGNTLMHFSAIAEFGI